MENELKKRLNEAIDYAVQSNYKVWKDVEKLWTRLKDCKNVCIFGLGKYYNDLKEKGILKTYFGQHIIVNYVCDNDVHKQGLLFETNIPNVKCLSLQELAQIEDVVVLVTVGNSKEIINCLEKLNMECYPFGMLFLREYDKHYSNDWFEKRRNRIIEAYELLEDEKSKEVYTEVICNRIAPHLSQKSFEEIKEENEYFETGLIQFYPEEECIVECGAYIGDSLEKYMQLFNAKVGKYYCFEMNDNIADICQNVINKYDNSNIILIRAGVSNRNADICIANSGTLISSSTQKKGSEYLKAKIVKLDDYLGNCKVTFIKMDIEGEEIRALEGAEKIIKEQTPNLAISAYHFLDDLWEIPLLIHTYNKNYKLYMRHHTTAVWDTDCYAIAEKGE